MTKLPLIFRTEADHWAENYPNTLKLECGLNLTAQTLYQRNDPNEQAIRDKLAATIHRKLFGEIEEKIAAARSFCLTNLRASIVCSKLDEFNQAFDNILAEIPKPQIQ